MEKEEMDVDTNTHRHPTHPPAPPTNRAMRRRPSKITEQIFERSQWHVIPERDTKNVEDPPTPRQLETHRWHAKRMKMEEQSWSKNKEERWILPMSISGRGRGSRGFIHSLTRTDGKAVAAVHDASYWCPILVSGGDTDPLDAVLKRHVDEEVVERIRKQETTAQGVAEVETMFVDDLAPSGSPPHGQALCPVKIVRLIPPDGTDGEINTIANKYLVWAHGGNAQEVYRALCASLPPSGTISVDILDLRRIEVHGEYSRVALTKALFLSKQGERKLPATTPTVLLLPDPRLCQPISLGPVSTTLLDHLPASITQSLESFEMFGASPQRGLCPRPLPDDLIARARQAVREQMVLGNEEPSSEAIDLIVTFIGDSNVSYATHVPVMILPPSPQTQTSAPRLAGWSLVLPPRWVMPVWMSLIFNRCRAVGQIEWRWVKAMEERAFFPADTPDTQAYWAATWNSLKDEEEKKVPKGNRRPTTKNEWENIVVGGVKEDEQDGNAERLAGVWGADVGLRVARSIRVIEEGILNPNCMVETLVSVVKRGVIREGARICRIVGDADGEPEPGSDHLLPYYTKLKDAEESNRPYVSPERLEVVGLATSPAVEGLAGIPTMAICRLVALRELQSSQGVGAASHPLLDVKAWALNPHSSMLFPITLSVLQHSHSHAL